MNSELFSHPQKNKNIYLINMTRERGYFSEIVQKGISKYIRLGKKILCIINKKGFASGLFCNNCGHSPQCNQCSVSIAYHDIEGVLLGLCHICKCSYSLPQQCPECKQSESLKLYGLTLQKTTKRIEESFGITPLVLEAKKVSSQAKINKLLPEIEQAQIVVGTNIAGELRNTFDLTIVLSADQSLSLPDYGVRQDVFVQLYQLIEKNTAPTILIQSYNTKHDSVRYACRHDRDGFMKQEQAFRSKHHYPPYGELCVIKYKNENESTLHNSIQKLTQELLYLQKAYNYTALHIYSTPPLIYKKFGKFYYHIIIIGETGKVRPFMDICFSKLEMRKRLFKIDWMANRMV